MQKYQTTNTFCIRRYNIELCIMLIEKNAIKTYLETEWWAFPPPLIFTCSFFTISAKWFPGNLLQKYTGKQQYIPRTGNAQFAGIRFIEERCHWMDPSHKPSDPSNSPITGMCDVGILCIWTVIAALLRMPTRLYIFTCSSVRVKSSASQGWRKEVCWGRSRTCLSKAVHLISHAGLFSLIFLFFST